MQQKQSSLIAVVDDERDILELVDLHLRRAGFETVIFERSRPFLDSLSSRLPDLVILDLMLPDLPGHEVMRLLGSDGRTARLPVIMLTALGSESDRIAGLDSGADDYLPKPFSPAELVARVKAVLRRAGEGGTGILEVAGMLRIDFDRYEVSVKGNLVSLTSTEFRLLRILVDGGGRVFSREKLLELLWEGEKFVFDRTIDVHITNLRAKLGEAGGLIQSVRGVGYRMKTL
jgi:DNA-binding response OmpR family regulator